MQTDGFTDLKEAHRFLLEQFGDAYSLSGVWYLLRIRLKAKLKTGRPRSVHQDPKDVEAFKKKGLAEAVAAHPDTKLHVFAQDEARFGLRTWHKRRWMAEGLLKPGLGSNDMKGFTCSEPLSL